MAWITIGSGICCLGDGMQAKNFEFAAIFDGIFCPPLDFNLNML